MYLPLSGGIAHSWERLDHLHLSFSTITAFCAFSSDFGAFQTYLAQQLVSIIFVPAWHRSCHFVFLQAEKICPRLYPFTLSSMLLSHYMLCSLITWWPKSLWPAKPFLLYKDPTLPMDWAKSLKDHSSLEIPVGYAFPLTPLWKILSGPVNWCSNRAYLIPRPLNSIYPSFTVLHFFQTEITKPF